MFVFLRVRFFTLLHQGVLEYMVFDSIGYMCCFDSMRYTWSCQYRSSIYKEYPKFIMVSLVLTTVESSSSEWSSMNQNIRRWQCLLLDALHLAWAHQSPVQSNNRLPVPEVFPNIQPCYNAQRKSSWIYVADKTCPLLTCTYAPAISGQEEAFPFLSRVFFLPDCLFHLALFFLQDTLKTSRTSNLPGVPLLSLEDLQRRGKN